MPQVKVQDSDGREQIIIAPAVIGLGIAKETDTYVVKIVATTQEEADKLVVATVKYLFENHSKVFSEEILKIIRNRF